MATPMALNICSLPSDPLLHVLSYLNYDDLCRCSCTCKRLKELAGEDELWKRQSSIWWLSSSCSSPTWRRHFKEQFKSLGRYIKSYRVLYKTWAQLETFLAERCPRLLTSIKAGATERELDEIEVKIRYPLPRDVRCSYRIHNGQKLVGPGLMGCMSISNHMRSEYLLDLQTASDCFQEYSGMFGCLPLTLCIHTGCSQFMALSEREGYLRGQVFYPSQDHVVLGPASIDQFISGNNFTDWFTTHVQRVVQGDYPIIQERIYKYLRDPDCIAVTNNVTVTVGTSFCPELSTVNPPHYFFTYRIRMSMDKSVSPEEACQLDRRYWLITNADGWVDQVEGPGVVGEFPIIRPGTTYEWTSCTTFNTPTGTMRGYFTMHYLKTGQPLKVECPIYHMRALPTCSAGDRRRVCLIPSPEEDEVMREATVTAAQLRLNGAAWHTVVDSDEEGDPRSEEERQNPDS
ncbi:F-box only protein 3-like isoform X2 [Branchiostoma floridae x Branchiostoma belcheri]